MIFAGDWPEDITEIATVHQLRPLADLNKPVLRATLEKTANAEFIVRAGNAHQSLLDALTWILPMAAGYARLNPVGKNADIVRAAATVLGAITEGDSCEQEPDNELIRDGGQFGMGA
jgi:hypothetical protein